MDYDYYLKLANRAIERVDLPAEPAGLYEPIRYALGAGGKRLRPVLTLAVCHALDRDPEDAIHQAVAIEVFHNFTLLHDDVMDNADMRRLMPTVHKKWNANTAILSGDAMLTLSTMLAMVHAGPRLAMVLDLLNNTAMGVYEGQQLDMDYEQRSDVTMDEYIHMIRLKTAILLGCACTMGAVMADVNREVQEMWFSYGENLGLAFQLQDDYLDTFGDSKTFGKTIGGDIANDKNTWLRVKAREMAPVEVGLITRVKGNGKFDAMKALYEELGLPDLIHQAINKLVDQSIAALKEVGLREDSYKFFVTLAQKSALREK